MVIEKPENNRIWFWAFNNLNSSEPSSSVEPLSTVEGSGETAFPELCFKALTITCVPDTHTDTIYTEEQNFSLGCKTMMNTGVSKEAVAFYLKPKAD